MSGNYQAFDLNHQSVNPKPWSQTDDASFSNEVNKIHRVPGKATSTPAGDGKETISYDNKFDPLGLNQIYTIGATKYKNNLGFQTMIDNLSRDTGPTSQSLKDLYKSEYGTDATHPEDIAAAYALSKNGDKGIEPKIQNISPNSQIAFGQKKTLAAINSGNTLVREKSLVDYKADQEAAKNSKEAPDTEGMLQRIEQRSSTKPSLPYTVHGQQASGREVELRPDLLKAFPATLGGHNIQPDRIVKDDKTGDFTAQWFKRDDNNNPIGNGTTYALSDKIPPRTISRDAIKATLDKEYLNKGKGGQLPPASKKKVAGF